MDGFYSQGEDVYLRPSDGFFSQGDDVASELSQGDDVASELDAARFPCLFSAPETADTLCW